MSVPGNINPAPPPSSFDDDPNFYEESRWAKFKRRIVEEPLIPLGCALTCWALFEASRSIRTGDKHKTNRMFRRRIYAQGFTVLAMVAGSVYWEGDRKKRKQYDGLVEERKKKEKHEKWIRELEVREQEEEELRRLRDSVMKGQRNADRKRAEREGSMVEEEKLGQQEKKMLEAKSKEELGQPKGGLGVVKSVLEESERRRPILRAAMALWEKR